MNNQNRSLEDYSEASHREMDAGLLENGEMLRLLVSAAPDAIVILNHESRLLFWNQAAAEMLGYAFDEMPAREMIPWLTLQQFHDVHRSTMWRLEKTDGGTAASQTEEIMVKRRDGTSIPVEVSVSGIQLQGDLHALWIMRDISERKRVEEEWSQYRNFLNALMENSEEQIYFKDLQSRFLWCSAAQVDRLLNCQGIDDVVGKTDHDFYAGEHADQALSDEQEIIRTGEPISGKVEKETWPDGRVTWVLTNKTPFRNETGEIIGTFGISKDITAIKEAEIKVEQLHKQVVTASRQAGMAEVATSVLHNIGNVLNSVNVSCSMISEKVVSSKIASLSKVVTLLKSNADDLPGYFSSDAIGQQLPVYLEQLTGHLKKEQEEMLQETKMLVENIHHIKEVIAMQQDTARRLGLVETLPVADLVEDALRLNLGAVERHGIELVREYSSVPAISVEKNKVLQILVNLIRNAKYACDDSGRMDKLMTIRIESGEEDSVLISVEDNGVGIPKENFTRIFNHGFTTRKEGHGFGLHSGALAAKELGGKIHVFSDGPGRGAKFTLELPLQPQEK